MDVPALATAMVMLGNGIKDSHERMRKLQGDREELARAELQLDALIAIARTIGGTEAGTG
jgi:hypothetical protein